MNEQLEALLIFILCYWLLFVIGIMLDNLIDVERGHRHAK